MQTTQAGSDCSATVCVPCPPVTHASHAAQGRGAGLSGLLLVSKCWGAPVRTGLPVVRAAEGPVPAVLRPVKPSSSGYTRWLAKRPFANAIGPHLFSTPFKALLGDHTLQQVFKAHRHPGFLACCRLTHLRVSFHACVATTPSPAFILRWMCLYHSAWVWPLQGASSGPMPGASPLHTHTHSCTCTGGTCRELSPEGPHEGSDLVQVPHGAQHPMGEQD